MSIIEQAKKIRAAADRREQNEQKIRQALREFLKNPLKGKDVLEQIRRVLGM